MLGTRADREAQVIQADSLQVEPITGLGDRRRPNNIPLVANTTPPGRQELVRMTSCWVARVIAT